MNGKDWRSFNVYLFDIDGTLLNCRDAVQYFAFCHVLSAVAGRPLDLTGVTAHGNVDTGILRDAFAFAGIEEALWRPRLASLLLQMGAFCQERSAEMRIELTPGVPEVLTMLRSRGAKLGVATGNLRTIGELKLGLSGLLPLFDFAAWSDGCESRAEVFAHGLALGRCAAGAQAAVLVVGDTPADVHAARAHGLPVMAVAGGIYSYAQLAAEQPDWCFVTIADALQAPA